MCARRDRARLRVDDVRVEVLTDVVYALTRDRVRV
jgi:hypothetical protein